MGFSNVNSCSHTYGNFNDFEADSLLYNIGNYFANSKRKCPRCLKTMFVDFQCKSTQNIKKRLAQTNQLFKMLHAFPGVVKLDVQNPTGLGYPMQIEANWNQLEGVQILDELLNELKLKTDFEVQSITVMFPWANAVLSKCRFIEMDASFKALNPYCFCLANAIYNNESYPIGISISPSENETLYSNFIELSINSRIDKEIWLGKSLLSDMHPSLIKFASEYCRFHYFCHRHILEYFGTNSGLFIFVSKLLRCCSYEEYDETRLDILCQLEYLNQKRKELNRSYKTFDTKSNDLKEMLSGNDTPKESKWHFAHWALWVRAEEGVSSCSNHNEGFHKGTKINAPNVSFLSKISYLLKKVMKHVSKLPFNHGKSVLTKMNHYKEMVIAKLKEPGMKLDYFFQENCSCNKDFYLSNLYGTSVNCKHKLLTSCSQLIIKMNEADYVKKEIVLIILIKDKEIKTSDKKLKVEEIKKEIRRKFPTNQFDPSFLESLISSVLGCFEVALPNMITIEHDYNFQNMFIKKANSLIEFKGNNSTPSKSIRKIKQNDDLNDFWMSDIENNIIRKINKLKYETVNEIQQIYPDLIENQTAMKICDFQFRKYFFQRNDAEIEEYFPIYKIECWAEADKSMNSLKLLDI